MTRCGCAGSCSCSFEGGHGIRLFGSGSLLDPITVERTNAAASLRGVTTESVAIEVVSGNGTADNPYVLSATRYVAENPQPASFTFIVPGIYTLDRPLFGTVVTAHVVGAGGGGGAGGNAPAPTYPFMLYGMGGAAGQDLEASAKISDTASVWQIAVGYGGTGAVGRNAMPPPAQAPAGGYSELNLGTNQRYVAKGGSGGVTAVTGSFPYLGTAGSDPNPTQGAGGRGGAFYASASPAYWMGNNGSDGYSRLRGATGGVPGTVAGDGSPGTLLRPRGGGGAGGKGYSTALGGAWGLPGGNGSRGGGGGGGGAPSNTAGTFGGNGGRGGHGVVTLVIQ